MNLENLRRFRCPDCSKPLRLNLRREIECHSSDVLRRLQNKPLKLEHDYYYCKKDNFKMSSKEVLNIATT
jgi:hypothetical protein